MALVGGPAGSWEPRLLDRAARPGRVRGIATELLQRVFDAPRGAGGVLRRGLRGARALHSRERRLVSTGLREVLRHRGALTLALDAGDPEALWLGWLVACGLEVAVAHAERPLPYARLSEVDALVAALDDPVERVAVQASVGLEGARALHDALGGALEAFLDASNQQAPVFLRSNPLRCTREALLARLAAEGVDAAPAEGAYAVEVSARAPLTGLKCFRDGWFEVQDLGSQQLAAAVPRGEVVVDLCAGAGGKTLALGVHRPRRLVAVDIRDRALTELRKRATRAGVGVETVRWEEGAVAGLEADVVLADVPCTGTGVWRRHPEHRLSLTGDRLAELGALQHTLVERAAALVRPGGWLCYATCSVLTAENDHVAARALDLGFTLEETRRWAPHTTGTDGFYLACLRRAD